MAHGSTGTTQSHSQGRASRSLRGRDGPIYQKGDTELHLTLRDIRKKLNFKENAPSAERPPKRVKRDTIPCFVYLAIWDNRQGFISAEPICKQQRACTLYPYEGSSGSPAVRIEMNEPFKIKAENFFVPVRKDGKTIMTMGDKYAMEVKIVPQHSTEMWPPIPILNRSEGSLNPDGTKRVFGSADGFLVSNYLNLPFAPSDDAALSVAFDQSGRTYKSKYGLQVSSHWRAAPNLFQEQYIRGELHEETNENPVPWYNSEPIKIDSSEPRPKKKPAPKAPKINRTANHMNDTVRVKPKTCIYYLLEPLLKSLAQQYEGFKDSRVEGLWCPVCPKEYQTIRQLLFHLTSYHWKCRFTLEQDASNDSTMPEKVTINVGTAENSYDRISNRGTGTDMRHMNWIAPHKPLDADAYLDGDHSWLGGKNLKRKLLKQQPIEKKEIKALATPVFRLPSEVPDLGLQKRVKPRVPRPRTAVPTPLFRSISHQLVVEDEEVSETDDEIEQTWLKLKHRAKLADDHADVFSDEIQRRLRTAFDEHLMDERFPNTRYLSDAFVRFLRKMDGEDWIFEGKGRLEVMKMCSEMIKEGIMDGKVLSGIINMIDLRSSKKATDVGTTTTDGGREQYTSAKVRVSYEPGNDPDMNGMCGMCSKYISPLRRFVTCQNTKCSHSWRTYHLDCLDPHTRFEEYVCPECIAQGVRLVHKTQAAELDSKLELAATQEPSRNIPPISVLGQDDRAPITDHSIPIAVGSPTVQPFRSEKAATGQNLPTSRITNGNEQSRVVSEPGTDTSTRIPEHPVNAGGSYVEPSKSLPHKCRNVDQPTANINKNQPAIDMTELNINFDEFLPEAFEKENRPYSNVDTLVNGSKLASKQAPPASHVAAPATNQPTKLHDDLASVPRNNIFSASPVRKVAADSMKSTPKPNVPSLGSPVTIVNGKSRPSEHKNINGFGYQSTKTSSPVSLPKTKPPFMKGDDFQSATPVQRVTKTSTALFIDLTDDLPGDKQFESDDDLRIISSNPVIKPHRPISRNGNGKYNSTVPKNKSRARSGPGTSRQPYIIDVDGPADLPDQLRGGRDHQNSRNGAGSHLPAWLNGADGKFPPLKSRSSHIGSLFTHGNIEYRHSSSSKPSEESRHWEGKIMPISQLGLDAERIEREKAKLLESHRDSTMLKDNMKTKPRVFYRGPLN